MATLPTLSACQADADVNDIFVGDTSQWATQPRAIFRRAGQRSIAEASAARVGGGFLKSATSAGTSGYSSFKSTRVARFESMLIGFFASRATDFSSSDAEASAFTMAESTVARSFLSLNGLGNHAKGRATSARALMAESAGAEAKMLRMPQRSKISIAASTPSRFPGK